MSLAVLGLAAVLTRSGRGASSESAVLARYAAFAVGVGLLARASIAGEARRSSPRPRAPLAAAGVLGCAAIACLTGEGHPLVVTACGAAAEEFVFRRELPAALARHLATNGRRTSGVVAGLLWSQVLFATCHFLIPAPAVAPFAMAPFARLVAAGIFLALLYRASGTLLAPITLHVWINATLRAGLSEPGRAPSAAGVVACAALAAAGLTAFEWTEGLRRARRGVLASGARLP